MAAWDAVVRFHAFEDDKEYFASVPLGQTDFKGCQVEGYASIEDIENGAHSAKVRVKKVNIERGPSLTLTLMLLTHVKLLAPVPALQPVVCIGLNYRKHVEESGVSNVYP
jgi:2-keto-4-pentenoate hydratase/2-oxohepta-3-ene-1,7-dioic acid hydratase in catechol pathway